MRWLVAVGMLVAAAVGTLIVVKLWDNIRETVAKWLRQQGLAKSDLMDAWVKLDSMVGTVRSRIFVKTEKTGKTIISETEYNMSEIDDEDVIKELEKQGYYKRKIMDLLD
ncbi:MAG: hypothetical protein MGG37_18910 [Trichodesmium sp. MAG_R01]|nr:hypothetical protein [Trichodesmium sp. MAG_R01]